LVRAGLLSSLSPEIAKQVERIKEASEIWRLLKGTYSGVGNEMLVCRVQRELHELSQGERSIVDHVSQLKKLWSDLDFYDSIELECGKCVEKFSKWTERTRVRYFLNGLNSKFESRRVALYWKVSQPGAGHINYNERRNSAKVGGYRNIYPGYLREAAIYLCCRR
jgi:hypothetical protein